jgi:hypothetical protein
MRRRLVAAAWIAGATVPLFLATVFLVGCCVLPFHGVMHRLMPVCSMVMNGAMNAMSGHDDAQSQVPARDKQEPAKRIAVTLSGMTRTLPANTQSMRSHVPSPAAYRSSISLGALRCDQDVGWYVLVATFLI